MVPLPTWPNPNEYDGSPLKSNPYLTAKEGTRKEEAGDCPPIDESKRLRQEGLLTFNQIVCLFSLLYLDIRLSLDYYMPKVHQKQRSSGRIP